MKIVNRNELNDYLGSVKAGVDEIYSLNKGQFENWAVKWGIVTEVPDEGTDDYASMKLEVINAFYMKQVCQQYGWRYRPAPLRNTGFDGWVYTASGATKVELKIRYYPDEQYGEDEPWEINENKAKRVNASGAMVFNFFPRPDDASEYLYRGWRSDVTPAVFTGQYKRKRRTTEFSDGTYVEEQICGFYNKDVFVSGTTGDYR